MIRHIVAWNLKAGLTEAEKSENARKIKSELEALTRYIPGIVSLEAYIDTLPSGNRGLVLNSLFESAEALAAYQVHPEHRRVAALIGAVTQDRVCLDYEE